MIQISQIETENNVNNLLKQNNNDKKEGSSSKFRFNKEKNTVSMIDIINSDMKNSLRHKNSKSSSISKKSHSSKKNVETEKKVSNEKKSSVLSKIINLTAEKNKDNFNKSPVFQNAIPNIFNIEQYKFELNRKENKKKKKNGNINGDFIKKNKTVIFWEKEKFEVLRKRFKEAKEKILKKTETDFETIKNNVISHENDKVL